LGKSHVTVRENRDFREAKILTPTGRRLKVWYGFPKGDSAGLWPAEILYLGT